MKNKINAIDLFCGIGGLTNGLESSGINVIEGYDIEPSVEYAYSKNNKAKFKLQDVSKLTSEYIKNILNGSEKTLIAGCAPCQPFSSYQRSKKMIDRKNHYKYPAFEEFIRIVMEVKPDYVTMENVRGITKDENFTMFVNDLVSFGYHIDYKIVNIANYGAAQNRNRLLLVGSLGGKIELPLKTSDPINLVDAIGHLPKLNAGERDENDDLHFASGLSDLNIQRIKSSKQGGTWRDWDKALLPECYKKESGQTFSSVYGRLSENKPSNTLTTQFNRYGTGRYGHYKQNRALSLREGAILQTFPNDYDFNVKKLGATKVAMHIGNAVPPIAGKVIGNIFMGDK